MTQFFRRCFLARLVAAFSLSLLIAPTAHGGLLEKGTIVRGQPNDIEFTYVYCLPFSAPPSGTIIAVFTNGAHDFLDYEIDIVPGSPSCPVATCSVPLPDDVCRVQQQEPRRLLASSQKVYTVGSGLTPGAPYTARLRVCDTVGHCTGVEIAIYDDCH